MKKTFKDVTENVHNVSMTATITAVDGIVL